jgi:hypothetical protein
MAHTYFLMKLPDQPEKVLVWDTRTLSVGRAPENAVVLADTDISRKHAIFMKEGTGCAVGDHQTGNGTFVNGDRVSGTQLLKDGDRIQVGKLEMVFYERDEHPAKLGRKLDYASHLMTSGMVPQGGNPNATMVGIMDAAPQEGESFVIEHNDGTGSDLFAEDVLELDSVAPKAQVKDLDFEFADEPPRQAKPAAPARPAAARPAPAKAAAPARAAAPAAAPARAADPGDSAQGDPVERMRRLKSLHAEGLITDDEFKAKRAQILEGM